MKRIVQVSFALGAIAASITLIANLYFILKQL